MNTSSSKLSYSDTRNLFKTIPGFIKGIEKITVFLTAYLIVCNVTAQEYQYVPFPDSNAVWSEVYWKPISEPYPRWVYNKYALFNEDTVINGITYHKLFHTNASEITLENSKPIGGIREDSLRRVIVNSSLFELVPEVEEVIVFDFSLNTGDTIWQDPDSNHTVIANISGDKLVVTDIDTLLINNTTRKVFSFDIPWIHWIEGIGSVKGLLFPSGGLPTNGMDNDLVCMHQNDTLLYYNSDYDGCVPSFVIDGVPLLPNLNVKVYPNPVTNGMVYFDNLDFETLELFDIKGNRIREETIKGLSIFKLKIPCLSPGVYTYRLTTKGLVPTQGKLIIQ